MVLGPLFAFHPLQLVAYFLSILIALAVKSSPYRRLFFLPVLGTTVYTLHSTTGDLLGDYYLAIFWFTYFWFASDYILFTDVQRELRQVPPNPQDKNGVENASLWRRVRWSVSLMTSLRGVGWAHEPHNSLPARPAPTTSRLKFILHQLLHGLVLFLIHDIFNLHRRWNPMFRSSGPGWRTDGWIWRALAVITWGGQGSTAMCLLAVNASILAVAACLSEPQYWPALMGDPRELYTIRRFWARGWHQMMLRFIKTHSRGVACLFGFRPQSPASALTQLFVAFALSASVHYAAEVMSFRSWSAGNAYQFFMLQPCGIILEDLVLRVGRKMGFQSPKWRFLGYFTTLFWFRLTLPLWQERLVRAGHTDEGIPVSIVMGVLKGQWMLPTEV
ncbi:MBOAT-2 domain-containing protein [Mycena kentingensis (nom. inval.)]|nr:MBOAT-2 domain-containing protein [Mycena kentingensis (nom. inval.)]